MSIAGSHRSSCRDYKPCSRQSPGSARRGRDVNPASSTESVQCRKAQTYVPVRDNLRSQPGREDHQAYCYSKGSVATESEEDRANATRSLSLEAIGAAVETTSHAVDRVPEVRGGDGTSTQPQAQQASNVGRLHHTSRRGISGGANQDWKTTKHTAIARAQNHRNRGRQGQRHTMSIAGGMRTRLS